MEMEGRYFDAPNRRYIGEVLLEMTRRDVRGDPRLRLWMKAFLSRRFRRVDVQLADDWESHVCAPGLFHTKGSFEHADGRPYGIGDETPITFGAFWEGLGEWADDSATQTLLEG